MEFISKNNCSLAVDSFKRGRNVVETVSVGRIGEFEQVVRIYATPAGSSRAYFYDMVVGVWEGSSDGLVEAGDRGRVALQLTLTSSDVAERLQERFGKPVTLLFGKKPMPPQLKEMLRQDAQMYHITPMDYQLA